MAERTDAGRRAAAQDVTREMRRMRGIEEPSTTNDATNDTTTTGNAQTAATHPAPEWSWGDYGSWPLSVKFAPAYVALLGIFIAVYYQNFVVQPGVDMSTVESCRGTFNFTFRINAARHQAEQLSTRSWEIGTAAEAVTELVNPEKAVFAADPFPRDKIPGQGLHLDQAIIWAYQKIRVTHPTLAHDNTAVSDPAALGVAAIMTGQRWEKFLHAAQRQRDFLLHEAPRYANGAISHRLEVPELSLIHISEPTRPY